MSKKFEPCPRYGKDVELFTVRSNAYITRRFFQCPSCGLRTENFYNNLDEAITIWKNFVSANTCTYRKKISLKNEWECSLCHQTWIYSEGASPVRNSERFCSSCGSRIQDYLDEDGKSVKGGKAS